MNYSIQSFKLQSFKVSMIQCFEISKFRSFKVSKFQLVQVSSFQSYKASKLQKFQTSNFSNSEFESFRFPNCWNTHFQNKTFLKFGDVRTQYFQKMIWELLAHFDRILHAIVLKSSNELGNPKISEDATNQPNVMFKTIFGY